MDEDSIIDMLFGPGDRLTASCNCPASPTVVITVRGEIDLVTEDRFEQRLRRHLRPQAQIAAVTIDLTGVRYISARAVSIIADAADQARHRGIGFTIIGGTPGISRIIAMWQSMQCSPIRLV